MAQIQWTIKASRDFDRPVEHYEDWSPAYADRYVDELLALIETLREFPRRGRILPELNDPRVRQLIFRGYRIIYDIKEDMVRLLGIRHGSANLARELRLGLWGDI